MKEAALNFVKRGMICLEDEDFDKADSFFEKALDEDAECSDAYFGLLLSDRCCKNEKELAELGLPVEDDRNFALAKRFATEEQTEAYNRISKEIVEAARKKAVVCGDNKEYSLALAWLTRIDEAETQYGKFYQMGVLTDGFTALNVSTMKKYSEQAEIFLSEVTSEELKERFTAANEAYLAFIQKSAEEAEKERIRREQEEAERKIQKEAEEKRKAEEAVLKAEEKKRREAEKKKRKEEAEKQRLERLARERKRRIRKNVITVVILLALAGFIAIFATIIYPNILYNSAVDAINEQRYSSAIHDLTDLGHKDSEELLKKANYLYAEQFFENEDYENARTYYQAAGNYLDAEEKAVESHQRKLYSEGNYKELVTLYGVTEIRVPDGVHTIAGYAMAGLNQVTDIYLPKSVVKLDWGSLQGCSSLVAIHYEGTMQEWAMISKNWYWDADTGAYTVYCSDGEISKAS